MTDRIMHPVKSSLIAGVTFDSQDNTLYVEFKNGDRYAYHDFTASLYLEFLKAPSVGKFFLQKIKGVYEGVKV